jgi:6-phosphofructokinase 1
MRAFVCHAEEDSAFAIEMSRHLQRCFDGGVFYYQDYQRASSKQGFQTTINMELESECDLLLVVIGQKLATSVGNDNWQVCEAQSFHQAPPRDRKRPRLTLCIRLRDSKGMPYELPPSLLHLRNYPHIDAAPLSAQGLESSARSTAAKIVEALNQPWLGKDDLPLDPHLFSFEKDVADFFSNKERVGSTLFDQPGERLLHEEMRRKILWGCPSTWPAVRKLNGTIENKNPQRILGEFRAPDATVVVSARGLQRPEDLKLTFPEAGPRQLLRFATPGQALKVAILVSGGIAPGTNAVIDGIVQRHERYSKIGHYDVHIYGVQNGFSGITPFTVIPLSSETTSRQASLGGSLLTTSRVETLLGRERQSCLDAMAQSLESNAVDILYVIGGDGSMRAAHALWATQEARQTPGGRSTAVVGVPKTMDNDILWVWQSFGFLSAVEKAREIVEDLSTEVRSNPRACVVQLFGSDSGFVVSHAVLASSVGTCDAALIPEVPFCIHGLTRHLVAAEYGRERPPSGRRIPSTMVVMAETAIPLDARDYIKDPNVGLSTREQAAIESFLNIRASGRRIQGQTPDELRDAGLKIVLGGIRRHVERAVEEAVAQPTTKLPQVDWSRLRLFSSEPRHLLRAIAPNTVDLITAQRLGLLAVDNAVAGYTDFMISQWLTEYVLVPLKLVILGRKRIPEEGMFWKSVLAKTGQPASMVCEQCRGRAT